MLVSLTLVAGIAGCHSEGGGSAIPAAVSPSSIAPSQGGLRGDLNGSGTPDITDAVGILRIIVALDPANALADCDCDGLTGITDAIALLRCLVGLAEWPIVCECPPGEETIGPDGQTFVWVPGGSFMMGSAAGREDEAPVHQVTLDGFRIGKHEVTNDAYAAFLNDAQPADVSQWLDIDSWDCGIVFFEGVYQAKAQLGQHPVVMVTWHGAVAYCEHYGYRLPTEAEWEYAAAGPGARVYPWGNEWDGGKCCHWGNRGPLGETFAVASFPAGVSWCGALDMAGNVWEWCSDWYSATYYTQSPAANPTGPDGGGDRVLRGGSWYNNYDTEDYFRCAVRLYYFPTNRYDRYGFRCAWSD